MTEHTGPRTAGLLARLSNALQWAGQHRGRGSVWIAVVVWLLVGGVVWTGMVASAVASLHLDPATANQGGAAGAAGTAGSGQATGLSVCFGLVAIATLLYTRVAGGIPWASLGMRWRGERQRIFGGAAGATVVYLAAMLVADLVFQGLTSSAGNGQREYPGMSTPGAQRVTGDITSVTFAGGIWEELTLLAIPVALFTALVPLKTMGRTGRNASWSVLVVVLLAARWAIHLYYGVVPALHVLVWAAAAVALFAASGTIWPLILAHSLYDAATFTAARIPAANAVVSWLPGAAVGAAVIVLAGTGRSWWNRTRQARPNPLTSGEGI